MAIGQTLIFGIMKVVNLAQGAMVILGAYLAYQLFTSFGIDPFLAIPITTVILFVIGVAVQLLFLRPLRKDDRSELSLLVTFAVALLLEGIMSVSWSTNDRSINTGYANSSWTVFGYQITLVRLYAFILSLVALGLLYLLLNLPMGIVGFVYAVTMLSLGAGQCAVIEPPDGAPLLFDAGSSSIADLIHKVIGPFLRSAHRS